MLNPEYKIMEFSSETAAMLASDLLIEEGFFVDHHDGRTPEVSI